MANLFDPANAPTGVPTNIIVGDFVQFKISEYSEDYPNTAYTMTFLARIATGNSTEITFDATASGDDYLFSVGSSTSENFDVGHYHYQLEIKRNSDNERLIVDRGEIDVLTDLDNNIDPRTHAEIMLGKIEGLLEGKADADVSSYSINNRSLTKLSPDELVEWRDYYRREVADQKRQESITHGRKTSATILMRF